jgi:hypothetical protein
MGWSGRCIGLDPLKFGMHSLRRSKATLIYRRTGNLRPCNCYWAIRRRARCDILASRLMMPLRSPRKSRSEVPGAELPRSARLPNGENGHDRTLVPHSTF